VIGNIFIGISGKDGTYIKAAIEGLSDHDAELLVIKNVESI
jgi:hypothetical protein